MIQVPDFPKGGKLGTVLFIGLLASNHGCYHLREAKRNSGAFLRQQTPPREAFWLRLSHSQEKLVLNWYSLHHFFQANILIRVLHFSSRLWQARTSFNATWSHLRCRQRGAADVAWRWWYLRLTYYGKSARVVATLARAVKNHKTFCSNPHYGR